MATTWRACVNPECPEVGVPCMFPDPEFIAEAVCGGFVIDREAGTVWKCEGQLEPCDPPVEVSAE